MEIQNTNVGDMDNLLNGKKIVWVEDDKLLSDLIARKLSNNGSKLIHISNGENAVKAINEEKPDLIMLDIILPTVNGFEILEKVKSDPETKNIPVILFSNLGSKEDIDKGIKLGAERFLVKAALTLDEVLQEIKKVLAEKGK